MKKRGETPTTYNEAVYSAVHRSSVPPKMIADHLGISESTLYNAANPNSEEPQLPRKHIVPLTRFTKNFAILDYFEHAVGRVAFEIPSFAGSFSSVAREAAETTEHFGVLLRQIGSALENDGLVDMKELRHIEPACLKLIETIARLSAVARQEAESMVR